MIKRLKTLIDKSEIVSFDVYDTLINRDINHYTDIFRILEKKAINRFGDKYIGFAETRIQAEKRARDSLKREIKLSDIYEQIHEIDDEINQLMKLEEETEINNSRRNKEIDEIVEYCQKKQKTIIVISDMYLGVNVIRDILAHNGFEMFSNIYVSSEFYCTKRNGGLFNCVIEREGRKADKFLHIGDNFRSDYIMAKAKGLNAYLIKSRRNVKFLKKTNSFFSFINNRISLLENKWERIGYEVYGPLMFGFLQWIHRSIKGNNIRNIYFASRDGYILEKMYKLLYDEGNTYYLKVSRRSVQVPMINNDGKGFKSFCDISSFSPISDNQSIYRRIGFPYRVKEVIRVNQDDILEFLNNDETIQNNLNLIYDEAYKERMALKCYLEHIGFEGKVAFVDVGWKCSTQKVLTYLSEAEIYGYYFGVHDTVQKDIKASGYLFDRIRSEEFYTVMGALSLIEAFLTAPEKSLVKYIMKDGVVDFIYDESSQLRDNQVIESLQRGALHFIRDISDSEITLLKYSIDDTFGTLREIMNKPDNADIETFGSITMENEGEENRIINTTKKNSIKDLLSDYGKSGWKIGFVKYLFKVPLPYYKLFKLAYKTYKK